MDESQIATIGFSQKSELILIPSKTSQPKQNYSQAKAGGNESGPILFLSAKADCNKSSPILLPSALADGGKPNSRDWL